MKQKLFVFFVIFTQSATYTMTQPSPKMRQEMINELCGMLDTDVSDKHIEQYINDNLLTKQEINQPGIWKRGKDSFHYTPLGIAVVRNRMQLVPLIVARGADVNNRDNGPNGEPPLFLALANRSIEMIDVLLKNGARKNISSTIGMPLKIFARKLKEEDAQIERERI